MTDLAKRFAYDKLYDLAVKIARKAHKGQFRHDGVTPYITHPFALADMFDRYLDKSVAILHDAVEDGADQGVTYDYIEDQLERGGFDDASIYYVMEGVKLLTHDKDEDTYMEYVGKVGATMFAKFKIGDITVNLSDDPTDYQKAKYRKAMSVLIAKL